MHLRNATLRHVHTCVRQADREVQEYRAKIRQRRQQQQQQRHQDQSPHHPSPAETSTDGPMVALPGERAQEAAASASWPPGSKGSSGSGGSVSELSEPSTGGNLEVGGGQGR